MQMGGLKKTVRKVAHKAASITNPIEYRAFGKKSMNKVENWTDQNVWGPDPVMPTAESDAAAPAMVMPTPDDTALNQARKKRIAAQRARSGRLSTVLTNSDALGG